MEYKTKKNDNATVQITVQNTPEEVNRAFRDAYLKASVKIKIPGFRAGKAPLELIEKKLGESVAEDAARFLISNTVKEIIDDLDPPPINIPSFEIKTFDRNKGAEFTGIYDTFPIIKIGKYKKLKGSIELAEITDGDLSEEIENLRKSHALFKSREQEASQNGDRITLSLNIGHGGKSLLKKDDISFMIGESGFPGLDERVTGLKEGDKGDYTVDVPIEFPDPRYAGKGVEVSFTVVDCRYSELPELNDEFAKTVGAFESLAELKSKIREEMKTHADRMLKDRCLAELLKNIVADSKVAVPESMIEKEIDERIEQIKSRLGKKSIDLKGLASVMGTTAEKLKVDIRDAAIKSLTNNLIIHEITKKEAINVSDDSVRDEMRNRWRIPEEQISSLMGNADITDEIRGQLLYRAGMDWIFSNGDIKNGHSIPYRAIVEREKSS
jgi:trigger factor